MDNTVLADILRIVQDLAYTLMFLVCIIVSYLTLQQPKVKQWLGKAKLLVKAVLFICIAGILYATIDGPIIDILYLPRQLLAGDGIVYPVVDCLGGVLILAGLTAGIILLTRQRKPGE